MPVTAKEAHFCVNIGGTAVFRPMLLHRALYFAAPSKIARALNLRSDFCRFNQSFLRLIKFALE